MRHDTRDFRGARRKWLGVAAAVAVLGAVAACLGVAASGCDTLLAQGTCACTPVSNRAEPTWRCEAPAIDPSTMICEIVPGARAYLNCESPGSSPATFSGPDTSCSPGFCLSVDGSTCDVQCSCSP